MTDAPKKIDDFVHFHTHSDMSQLDGCGRISEYVKTASERGNKAIAFTDHGTMRGYYQQLLETQERGIKPIFGIEFYVANDMRRKGLTEDEKAEVTEGLKRAEWKSAIKQYEDAHGIRDRWHLTVWAKNEKGLKNLFKLSSLAYLEGFYYKPRIDLKTLMENGDGLIVATGCLSSPINDRCVLGQRKKAMEIADTLWERFGPDGLALEIQPHEIPDQITANKFILDLAKRWGPTARLMATQDAHYVHEGDHEHHEVLLCIGTGSNLSDPDRFRFDGTEFFMKTRAQMYKTFMAHHGYMSKENVKAALDNTIVFSEMVDEKIIEIDRFKCLLPNIEIPAVHESDEDAYARAICVDGWDWRDIDARARAHAERVGTTYEKARQIYVDRLKMELTAIRRQKFTGYFLIVRDLYNWARKQEIMCGPGRGSAAGSLVSYLMGITAVDPIEHGLLFERFISPTRIDMPDIDMDFEDVRRQEIIEYLRNKYGHDKVCQIATVAKLSGKQCLRDVARVLEVPLPEVNAVTQSIIERSSGDERVSQTIEDSFKEFKVCQEFDKKYPKVLYHAKKLEGMAKNLGMHAAGVVTSPVPLMEIVPLEVRKHEGKDIVVSAIDMYGCAAMGLLKLDVLGLRTLAVLKDAVKAIKVRHGVDLDLEALDLNDKKVLQGFTDHEYVGIFQYDSTGADAVCRGVNFVHFEDIAAMTALNRPGTARSGLATQYVERKKNPKLVAKASYHPKVSEITGDTLGIIVYQEHVLRIFTEVAGFTPATADSLRKKIAKKWGDESIGKERENFINGAVKNTPGMTPEIAGKLMDAITFFGSYGFNKSHATAYGVIAYWGMWLKTYYPLEFYWALLRHEPDRIRIQQFAKDAKKHDIELMPPSVSYSGQHFKIDPTKRAIRGSLVDIKGVGEAASGAIMSNQPYSDFFDFLKRVDRRKCHKGVILSLAKAGALDELLPNVKWFIENIEAFWLALGKRGADSPELRAILEKTAGHPDYAVEERQLVASSVNPLAFGKHPMDAYGDFLEKNVTAKLVPMSDEDFFKTWNNQAVFIGGVVVEVKYNQVGDFHTGAAPDDDEKLRMGWGKRYANINIEDLGGKQNRAKVDYDIFDDFRDVVDEGVGTPVIALVSVNKKYENLRAHFMVNLEAYRKKIADGAPLSIWERLIKGDHPALSYPWKPEHRDARVNNTLFKRGEDPRFTGVVTHVRTKLDKNMNEMGWFGLLGADGTWIEAMAFGSAWPGISNVVKPGVMLKIELDKKKDTFKGGWAYLFDEGNQIIVLKKSAAKKVA